jgi:hypothetical protein
MSASRGRLLTINLGVAMNAVGLAQAVAHAVIPDVLAHNRFQAARKNIEREPCLKPLRTTVWATAETMSREPHMRWRDMTNGVFWLVGE